MKLKDILADLEGVKPVQWLSIIAKKDKKIKRLKGISRELCAALKSERIDYRELLAKHKACLNSFTDVHTESNSLKKERDQLKAELAKLRGNGEKTEYTLTEIFQCLKNFTCPALPKGWYFAARTLGVSGGMADKIYLYGSGDPYCISVNEIRKKFLGIRDESYYIGDYGTATGMDGEYLFRPFKPSEQTYTVFTPEPAGKLLTFNEAKEKHEEGDKIGAAFLPIGWYFDKRQHRVFLFDEQGNDRDDNLFDEDVNPLHDNYVGKKSRTEKIFYIIDKPEEKPETVGVSWDEVLKGGHYRCDAMPEGYNLIVQESENEDGENVKVAHYCYGSKDVESTYASLDNGNLNFLFCNTEHIHMHYEPFDRDYFDVRTQVWHKTEPTESVS